jgi:hypothetical protein
MIAHHSQGLHSPQRPRTIHLFPREWKTVLVGSGSRNKHVPKAGLPAPASRGHPILLFIGLFPATLTRFQCSTDTRLVKCEKSRQIFFAHLLAAQIACDDYAARAGVPTFAARPIASQRCQDSRNLLLRMRPTRLSKDCSPSGTAESWRSYPCAAPPMPGRHP